MESLKFVGTNFRGLLNIFYLKEKLSRFHDVELIITIEMAGQKHGYLSSYLKRLSVDVLRYL